MTIAFAVLAVVLAALLVLLELRDRRQHGERERLDRTHRAELEVLRVELLELSRAHVTDLSALSESHRQEMAALNQARCEEVSNLCQRIQAPAFAAAAHDGRDAGPDPQPVNPESDEDYWEAAEQRMDALRDDLEAAGAPAELEGAEA